MGKTTPPATLFPPGVSPQVDRPLLLARMAERLSRSMGLARALAQNGRTVDLRGIDDGVGRLCAQTLDLPEQEGRQLLPVLHDVLLQVDALAAALHAHAPTAQSGSCAIDGETRQ